MKRRASNDLQKGEKKNKIDQEQTSNAKHEEYKKHLRDAIKSANDNPGSIEDYCRIVQYGIILQHFRQVEMAMNKLRAVDPSNYILRYKIQHLVTLGKYYKGKRTECLMDLQHYDHAITEANEMIKKDKINPDATYILAACYYYKDIQKSVNYFREANGMSTGRRKYDDLYEKALNYLKQKNKGTSAYNSGQFQKSYDLYSAAITVDPRNKIMQSTLFFNMGQASYKLGKIDRAIEGYTKALSYAPDYWKALVCRAECYIGQKGFLLLRAIQDLEKANQIKSASETEKTLLSRALQELKKFENDPYQILGVDKNASWKAINKAYRTLVVKYHTDHHAGASEEDGTFYGNCTKLITKAHRELKEKQPSNQMNSNFPRANTANERNSPDRGSFSGNAQDRYFRWDASGNADDSDDSSSEPDQWHFNYDQGDSDSDQQDNEWGTEEEEEDVEEVEEEDEEDEKDEIDRINQYYFNHLFFI